MSTDKQDKGDYGEGLVCKNQSCLKCKRSRTLRKLPPSFKCADIICDFCGYLAQIKTAGVKNLDIIPSSILAGAWKPQKERMDAGIFFPLFVVLLGGKRKPWKIYYLPADLQDKTMFRARKPLSEDAIRKGWQGFTFVFSTDQKELFVEVDSSE